MKNRNGFTLVELLAVIAILAILVIIALPNVINLYTKAQKETFLTETKKVYSEAEKKFISNSISNKTIKVISSEDNTKLDMTGEKLQYCVLLNNSGKITSMKVSNGKWIASLDNNKTVDELTIVDLDEGNLDSYECGGTNSSCFQYSSYTPSEDELTKMDELIKMFVIEDKNKCKTYVSSKINGISEQDINIICNGEEYEGDYIFSISSSDYESAGLKVNYVLIDSVKVVDVNKCQTYLSSKFNFKDDESKTLCTTNNKVDGLSLKDAVITNTIPSFVYDKAGLKVTTISSLNNTIQITKYDFSCGFDITIPSKIDGKIVASIADYTFSEHEHLARFNVTNNANLFYSTEKWGYILGVGECNISYNGNVMEIYDNGC